MDRLQNPNIEILSLAVEQLENLTDEFVFLGGCATGLLITDKAAPPIRVTRDVDAIVQVVSRAEYYRLSERLRNKGFSEDSSDGAPLCRWVSDAVILDVMPTNMEILGFGNEWYESAIEYATVFPLTESKNIQLVSTPYFLMTKLEAFDGRGQNDYMLSHDIEDIVAVIDGRPELLAEIEQSSSDLKVALSNRFRELRSDSRFIDAVYGHMPGDIATQNRVPAILNKINQIVEIDYGS
ncbi:MAG: hypothetical protein GY763_01545 [Gammaproteobacteria bacterium]|nr:hypothetical protein [Gammaproteobacteria bacterium]